MGAYKVVTETFTLDTALDIGEIDSLAQEMREWADNMGGTALEHTERYQQVEEAADTMENANSELESALDTLREALTDAFTDDVLKLEIKIGVSRQKRKGRGESRDVRLSNAITALQEAVDTIEAKARDLPEGSEKRQAIEDAAGEVGNILSDLEGVEFPGMY